MKLTSHQKREIKKINKILKNLKAKEPLARRNLELEWQIVSVRDMLRDVLERIEGFLEGE